MDIKNIAAGHGPSQALQDLAGKFGVDAGQAEDAIQALLGGVTAGGGIKGMLESVAAQVGVDPAQVQQFLPDVMSLLASLDVGNADALIDDAVGMFTGLFGGKES